MRNLFIWITLLFSFETLAGDHFNKVVMIVFENTNYSKAIAQADFKNFASKGLLLSNMYAETHPSQGNYVAMIAGSVLGVKNDKNVNLSETHLGDLLEKANKKWRVYAEDFPGNCFTDASSGKFYRKHVPFLSFTNVTSNPQRCANIDNSERFLDDLKKGNLADFNMYIPNIDSDGHNTGIDFAGKWLSANFGVFLNHPESLGDTLFIITFDESGASLKNQIYTVLIGKNIVPGSEDRTQLNHYSLLKLIEDELGLGNLGRNDLSASAIQVRWK